jgi:hypothetical protein
MKYVILTVFLAVLPTSALADSLTFKYGLGVVEGSATTKVKAFAFRNEESLGAFDAYTAVEGGLWTDTGKAEGRAGSIYGAYQVGVRPESGALVMGAFWGIAALSNRDSQLGGRLPQFKTDFYVGFQGTGSIITLGIAHISSAGIFRPNKGRDLIQMGLGLKW